MERSVARGSALAVVFATLGLASCGRTPSRAELPPPSLPQVAGTLPMPGLTAPVTVVRDRWGVPHITASSADDLFFAQGFVQAQDRLFQMDLWRRSVQGRLSEILGANFLERDAMSRRIQYHGDVSADWASYGADTERIAQAFTRGINAWVAIARVQVPEEFRLAGWLPQDWQPEDLLNRTDAFLSSVSAEDEILRARLVAALGVDRVDAFWPLPDRQRTIVDRDIELSLIGPIVGGMLRRVGTLPFVLGLAAPVTDAGASIPVGPLLRTILRERLRQPADRAWVTSGDRTATRNPMVAAALDSILDSPSVRYLVHLTAPGWNVAGVTSPWMPGVVVGHNTDLAWSLVRTFDDVQDIYLERLNPENPHQVRIGDRWVDMEVRPDTVPIKGRSEPFEFERQYTPHGVVVGVDRDRQLAYVVRWPGSEPGTSAELGALALDRALTADEFRDALSAWKLPVAEFSVGARGGATGRYRAGLVPRRLGANGVLPTAGWTNRNQWTGWDGVRPLAPPSEPVASPAGDQTFEAIKARLNPARAIRADVLIPLLEKLSATDPAVESARRRLLSWDRQMSLDSADAYLFSTWDRTLGTLAIERRVPAEFVTDLSHRIDALDIVRAPGAWFDTPVNRNRDALLLESLSMAVTATRSNGPTPAAWGDVHRAIFMHVLGISPASSRRFNVGPLTVAGNDDVRRPTLETATTFRAIFDVGDWDRSMVINAPGQSGAPESPHYADLAKPWAEGEYVPLAFSEQAVRAAAEQTLMLMPPR